MIRKAETASVAETETVPTMPGLPLSGATETVAERVNDLLEVLNDPRIRIPKDLIAPVTLALYRLMEVVRYDRR